MIVSDNQKYLILNAQRFQNEKWFAEANEVEAIGETKPDVMTTYMEGTPFEVRTMRPLAAGGSDGNQSELKRSHQSVGHRRLDRAGATGYRDPNRLSSDPGTHARWKRNRITLTKSDAVVRALKSAAGRRR